MTGRRAHHFTQHPLHLKYDHPPRRRKKRKKEEEEEESVLCSADASGLFFVPSAPLGFLFFISVILRFSIFPLVTTFRKILLLRLWKWREGERDNADRRIVIFFFE